MFSFCSTMYTFLCSGVASISSVTYTVICLVMQKTSASGVAFKKCYGCGSVLLDLRSFSLLSCQGLCKYLRTDNLRRITVIHTYYCTSFLLSFLKLALPTFPPFVYGTLLLLQGVFVCECDGFFRIVSHFCYFKIVFFCSVGFLNLHLAYYAHHF